MDDDDPQPAILEALRKLEFMCGTFQGKRRTWDPRGEAGPWEAIELQTAWELGGFYLYETAPHAQQLCYWGYDCYAKQYRRWVFAVYGHFFWGFPNPANWCGAFEGDSLVMTWDFQSSIPLWYATEGLHKTMETLPPKWVYTPGEAGGFTVTHHRKKRSSEETESFPGYHQDAETVYERRTAPLDAG